ncbi:MAG: response regulator [Anaerolineae bacterium]
MLNFDGLVGELRGVLRHLHDPAYLENHPLVHRIGASAHLPSVPRGQALQQILKLTIEGLDPGPGVPYGAPEARAYCVLRGLYILQQHPLQVAYELGVSRRQFYRELRSALEAVAQVLCYRLSEESPTAHPETDSAAMGSVQAEFERIAHTGAHDLDLTDLVAGVVKIARELARQRGSEVSLAVEDADMRATVNRVALRQGMLNLLSHIVQVSEGSSVQVRLRRFQEHAVVEFSGEGFPKGALDPAHLYFLGTELLDSIGVDWSLDEPESGICGMSLRIPLADQYNVLVVDDNEGLIRLFGRYLQGQGYLVHGAGDAEQAMEMLDRLRPEVVILDVMMPDRDGWEVLEALRRTEAERRVPVVVCSIIDDPELATALGADAFLHKPVDQSALLRTLAQVLSAGK